MKKSIYAAGSILLALTLAACTANIDEENAKPAEQGIPFSFDASTATRTTADGVNTAWAADDAMNVFHAATGTTTYVNDGKFTVTAAGATTFTGTLAESLSENPYDWYAVYPYNSAVVTPANTTTGAITVGATVQTQTGNSNQNHIDGSGVPLCGVVTNITGAPSFAMHHLTALVKVTVTNGTAAALTITSVQLNASASNISGTYYVDFSDPANIGYTAADAQKYVALTVSGGTAIAAGETADFYLAIKPFTGATSETMTMTLTDSNGAVFSKSASIAGTAFTAGKTKTLTVSADTFTLPSYSYYYYGTANCYNAYNVSSVTIDVTRNVSNSTFALTGTATTASPAATKAVLLWKEAGITSITVPETIVGNSFTVTDIAGTGNAGIAIMDGGKILWSYHIWKPEDDPTATLSYTVTKSGTYSVMPMTLGATAVVTADDDATEKAKGIGLYYQWGRKDPLGRTSTLVSGTPTAFVATVDASDKTLNWRESTKRIKVATALGTVTENTDLYMINYTIKNPLVFVWVISGTNNSSWTDTINNNLWGNPEGYNYPKNSETVKSVFDPCPAGYKVAPKDLYYNFTTNKDLVDSDHQERYNAQNQTTYNTDCGFAFYYQGQLTGATDFYPHCGRRDGGSGYDWTNRNACWCSSPYSSTNTAPSCLFFDNGRVYPMYYTTNRATGCPVRCIAVAE